MGLITYLIVTAVVGLFVGALARLALPGKDPMSIWETMGVGVLATFVTGLVWWAVIGHGGGSLVLSILVGTGIVYLIRRSRGGPPVRPKRS